MVVTKQQKILLGVLALGLTALGADRLVTGGQSGPAQAGAATSITLPTPAVAAAATPTGTGVTEPSAQRSFLAGHANLAARLAQLSQDRALGVEGMREAFVPTGHLANTPSPVATRTAAPAAPTQRVRYELEAVVANGDGGGIAVIKSQGKASQTLSVGDTLSGYRLTEIRNRSVVFTRGTQSLTLELATPPPPGSSPRETDPVRQAPPGSSPRTTDALRQAPRKFPPRDRRPPETSESSGNPPGIPRHPRPHNRCQRAAPCSSHLFLGATVPRSPLLHARQPRRTRFTTPRQVP